MAEKESSLLMDKHILICLEEENTITDANLDYLKKHFCGLVLTEINEAKLEFINSVERIIYLCGDINKVNISDIKSKNIYVIKELSYNYDESSLEYIFIDIGKVPINVHNVGIYFRQLFNDKDYFNLIKNEHQFQVLTESNKPNNALRKGIYLTKVEENNSVLEFNLLRCSSNFEGATDNFRTTDNEVINQTNYIAQYYFEESAELNHVLAQIYENGDNVKAKIKAHSDKTKDMPRNGLIAFCTFYDNATFNKIKKSKTDMFDICYNETSVLTRLHFKLKNCVKDDTLTKEFSVTLYPNSVFIIPLSTNRLYTHEIRPSILPANMIPVRMGYVIRCSKTKAVFKDGQTFIYENGECTKLVEANDNDLVELRKLYFEENSTDKIINYGKINFSMNRGDYLNPTL